MKNLTATLCLTIAVLLGSVGMASAQLLCVNGHLLRNKGMPVPSPISVLYMETG
jgi:hypothetical protein